MTFNEKELEEIEKLGGLFMEPWEVAVILEVEMDPFEMQMEDRSSEAFKAYWKGFLKSKTEVMESVVQMAKRDSSPAQNLVKSDIDKILRIQKS